MLKRLLSLLIVMFAVLMPMKSWAQEPYAVLSENNTVLTFYYDDQKTTRNGMSVGPFTGYTQRGWHSVRSSIIQVVFDDSFASYSPTSTALWFWGLQAMTSIEGIENLHTEQVTDMNGMFNYCYALEVLDLSNFNTANVTNIAGMFYGCNKLKSILVGEGWSTDNIITTTISGTGGNGGWQVFSQCTSLVGGAGTTFDANHTDYTFAHIDGGPNNPGYFTDKNAPLVADAEPYAVLSDNNTVLTFYYDGNKAERKGMDINSRNIPVEESSSYGTATTAVFDASFADYRPTSTANWFMRCSSLNSITGMENLKTDNVTDMSCMFAYCNSLEKLDFSGFKTENVTDMSHMFDRCFSLTSLDLSNFRTDNVTDMSYMFEYCTGLTSLNVSSFNTANVTDMSGLFYDCEALTNLDVTNFNTENVVTMSWLFMDCSSLSNIDVTHFNTANVTDMSSMFSGCSGLTSLDVSNLKTDNVKGMDFMFYGCSGLTTLDIRNFETSNVTNLRRMFGDCKNLASLDMSSFNTGKVKDMWRMFYGCSAIESLYVGNGWSTTSVTNGTEMFGGCTKLVGGAGTTYDANHTDYTYAHIDGGPNNPGYFTDKNASEEIAAPTFRFEGDSLFIETATKDASIFYQMADLPNMDEATVQKISESLTVTADAQQSIYYEQPIELKKSVVLKAIAAGATISEVSTLVYDYDAWQKLLEALDYGMDVSGRASDNSNVPDDMKEQLNHMLEEGKWGYYERMWNHNAVYNFTNEIMQLAHQMDEMMIVVVEPEPYAVLSENNTVLTFYYDDQKTTRNGMSVGPFAAETDRGWDEYKGNINTAIFDDSFANCSTITSTAYWFASCYNSLTIQGLNNLKTDNVTDMTMMFHSTWLKDIDVSGFNTSKVTSMRNMFSACSMSSLDVSNFNTENVTDFNGMFSSNSHLTNLDLSNFNTTNATSLRAMFSGCTQLTSIDLSSFNTANVTDMNNMFSSCTNLQYLDLSHFNTDKVRDIRRMFLDCRNLTSLDISSLKTDSVLSMEMLFENCAKLESLDLSSFNTKDIWEMRYMFDGCTNLKTIYVGNEWNTGKVSSGENMFRNCTSLVGGKGTTYDANHVDYTYAHIDEGPSNPGYFTDKNAPVISDDIIQFADANVKAICVQNWDTNGDGELSKSEAAAVTSLGGIFKNRSSITSFDEFRYFTGVSSINDETFENCYRLNSIKLPIYLKTIGNFAFRNCSLSSIEFPDSLNAIGNFAFQSTGISSVFITKNIVSLGLNPFDYCSYLESVVVDEQNPLYDSRNQCNGIIETSSNKLIVGFKRTVIPEGIVTIGTYAFSGCEFNTQPSFPDALKTIEDDAFRNSSGLTHLVLTEGIENLGSYAFASSEIEELTLPSTLKIINSSCFEFNNLRSVRIPSSVTYIGSGVFCGNGELEEIVVEEGNQVYSSNNCNVIFNTSTGELVQASNNMTFPEGVTSLGWCSFQGLAHVTKLEIPEGVTDLGNYTFYPCLALEMVSIPSTVSANGFHDVTFYDCVNLKSIYCYIKTPSDLPMKYQGPFGCNESKAQGNVDLIYKQATLYVPHGTKALYESLAGWSKFKNIVEMDATTDCTFDTNGVLTVGSETTMPEALEAAGGREEVAKTITAIVWNSSATLTNNDLQGLDNPNMLIYVKDAAFAPANRDNVVIGDFAKNIVLTDVESGNNNFYCPQAFTAEMISYTRNFQQQTEIGFSRGWETIALPFTVQTIMHEKNGVITPFGNDASEKHFWLRQLTQQGLAQARKIEANTPYLISMPNNDEYPVEFNMAGRVTFSSQNTVVPVTQLNGMEAPTATGGMVMIQPNFKGQSAMEMIYTLNVGEQHDGHPEGSIFVANYRAVRPFEAFTVHHGNGPAPQYISINEMTGDATSIEDVRGLMSNGRGENWYDLNGRRLQSKPCQKGVYLHDGRKVVIR